MTDQTNRVYIRFGGWIELVEIETESNGILTTKRNQRGIEAVCMPSGCANVSMWRGDIKVFDGLGIWSYDDLKIPVGHKIKIRRGTKVWNETNKRWRILDQTMMIFASGETEDAEWMFQMEGKQWTVDMESAEEI